MKRDFEYYLFDLDGTITNSAEGITNAIRYALHEVGVEVTDVSQLQKFIGPPLSYSFPTFMGLSEEDTWKAIEYFHVYYDEQGGLFEAEPYAGIPELLRDLQAAGKKVILATSKPLVTAERILERFDILKYFYYTDGANLDETKGTKVEVLQSIMDTMHITDPTKAVMIGDTRYDILGGKQFSLPTIGVLYGFGKNEEIAECNPDDTAESVDQLRSLLLT